MATGLLVSSRDLTAGGADRGWRNRAWVFRSWLPMPDTPPGNFSMRRYSGRVSHPKWLSPRLVFGGQDRAAPAIGGSGNAVDAIGAVRRAQNTPSQAPPIHAKAEQRRRSDSMRSLIPLRKLGDGVRRITGGYGGRHWYRRDRW